MVLSRGAHPAQGHDQRRPPHQGAATTSSWRRQVSLLWYQPSSICSYLQVQAGRSKRRARCAADRQRTWKSLSAEEQSELFNEALVQGSATRLRRIPKVRCRLEWISLPTGYIFSGSVYMFNDLAASTTALIYSRTIAYKRVAHGVRHVECGKFEHTQDRSRALTPSASEMLQQKSTHLLAGCVDRMRV